MRVRGILVGDEMDGLRMSLGFNGLGLFGKEKVLIA